MQFLGCDAFGTAFLRLAFVSAYFSCNFSVMNYRDLTGILEAAEILCSENSKSIGADSELTENDRIQLEISTENYRLL